MDPHPAPLWVAFGDKQLLASGPPGRVAEQLAAYAAGHSGVALQVFDDASSEPVDLDLRNPLSGVRRGLPGEASGPVAAEPPRDAARGPGRPKLGVVAREVTLLPRHWDWLTAQPGGASVALRKLVEQALRERRESERARLATEAAYRFMHAMAGDEPGFEEASRALFANDPASALGHMAGWQRDVREHAARLVERIAAPPDDGAATPERTASIAEPISS